MQPKNIRYILAILLSATPFLAQANMIWPSIYIVEEYYTWYVILIGLAIETIFAKLYLKTSWSRSFLFMLATNAISAVVGLLLIPFSGIVIEVLMLPFGGGTFDLSHWIIDYIATILANTLVEGYSLKWIFKYPLKPNFWWLFAANAISVAVSIASIYLKFLA